MVNDVLREEKKYLVHYEYFKRHSHYLSQILMQDSHNGSDGYKIRSLYFDTIDNKDYVEKENGVELRKKIRLRIYDPAADYAHLEMKQKQGQYQKKRSLKMSRSDAVELTKRNYSVLLKYEDAFAVECYAVMNTDVYLPRTIVEYKRFAFVAKENNIRLTFDSEIVATETNFNIFDDKLILNPVFDKYNVVFEVKYNGFLLEYIKRLLDNCDKTGTSVSKYCLARSSSLYYRYI